MLNRNDIVRLLERLQHYVGRNRMASLRIPEDQIDRASLGPYSTRKGLRNGQIEDRRYTLPGSRGLHEHRYHGFSTFHIDTFDAVTKPVRHLATDTRALVGAGVGLVGAFYGGWPLGFVGVAVGTLLGAHVARRELKPFSIQQALLISHHVTLIHRPMKLPAR